MSKASTIKRQAAEIAILYDVIEAARGELTIYADPDLDVPPQVELAFKLLSRALNRRES